MARRITPFTEAGQPALVSQSERTAPEASHRSTETTRNTEKRFGVRRGDVMEFASTLAFGIIFGLANKENPDPNIIFLSSTVLSSLMALGGELAKNAYDKMHGRSVEADKVEWGVFLSSSAAGVLSAMAASGSMAEVPLLQSILDGSMFHSAGSLPQVDGITPEQQEALRQSTEQLNQFIQEMRTYLVQTAQNLEEMSRPEEKFTETPWVLISTISVMLGAAIGTGTAFYFLRNKIWDTLSTTGSILNKSRRAVWFATGGLLRGAVGGLAQGAATTAVKGWEAGWNGMQNWPPGREAPRYNVPQAENLSIVLNAATIAEAQMSESLRARLSSIRGEVSYDFTDILEIISDIAEQREYNSAQEMNQDILFILEAGEGNWEESEDLYQPIQWLGAGNQPGRNEASEAAALLNQLWD